MSPMQTWSLISIESLPGVSPSSPFPRRSRDWRGFFSTEGALSGGAMPAPARECVRLGAKERVTARVAEGVALPVVCGPAAFGVLLRWLQAGIAARCVMHLMAPKVKTVSMRVRVLGLRLVLSNRSPCRWLVPARWAALRIAEVEALFGLRPALSWRDVWAGPAPIED